MPTADSHLHLFADQLPSMTTDGLEIGDDVARYERVRQRYGIERGLVIGFEGNEETRGNNGHILDLASTHAWIAPAPYLPPTPPPTVETLRRFRQLGAVGYAIYLEDGSDARALDAWSIAALAEIRSQAALLSFNVYAETSVLAHLVELFPGCPILVSHLGLPGRYAAVPTAREAREHLAPLLRLAGRREVAVKFSGLYAIDEFPFTAAQPFVDVLLDAFGPDRLLWGSDFPPVLEFVAPEQLADVRLLAHCSPAELNAVMGGNLLRLLGDRVESPSGLSSAGRAG